jgi:hypothetical protein
VVPAVSNDPNLSFYGHPVLPAGYNSWENNGDEIDGAGVNEPVWPAYFVSFETRDLMIINADLLQIFEDGCPDYVVPAVQDTIVFPREVETLVLRRVA